MPGDFYDNWGRTDSDPVGPSIEDRRFRPEVDEYVPRPPSVRRPLRPDAPEGDRPHDILPPPPPEREPIRHPGTRRFADGSTLSTDRFGRVSETRAGDGSKIREIGYAKDDSDRVTSVRIDRFRFYERQGNSSNWKYYENGQYAGVWRGEITMSRDGYYAFRDDIRGIDRRYGPDTREIRDRLQERQDRDVYDPTARHQTPRPYPFDRSQSYRRDDAPPYVQWRNSCHQYSVHCSPQPRCFPFLRRRCR